VAHCLLFEGNYGASVRVNRTFAIDEPFDTVFAGASPCLWRRPDTVWQLAYVSRDLYYLSMGEYVRPRDTWHLRVARDGLDTVLGSTVVPDTFSILYPHRGDTVTWRDSMVFSRSRNCAGYFMSFKNIEGRDTFYFDFTFANDTTGRNFDTLLFRIPQMVFLYQFSPGLHYLRVVALDSNYFDWVRQGGFGMGGGGNAEESRLAGGLGVFGSAVYREVSIYVRPDTTDGRPGSGAATLDADENSGQRTRRERGRVRLPGGEEFGQLGEQRLAADRFAHERLGAGLERVRDVLFLGPGR
jgi:hypothetical protein